MHEAVARETGAVAAPCSIRRRLLNEASSALRELGLLTPARAEIGWDLIAPIADGDALATARVLEVAQDAGLSARRLFVQACPHDEGVRRDLSFAGVFKTYHPKRALTQRMNVAHGLRAVLDGRWGAYADTYYARHGISGPRAIDAKLSSFVDGILTIGTGYVHGPRCLVQYFDSYLSLFINDPVRILATRDGSVEDLRPGVDRRLLRGLFGVSEQLATSLDVEFVVTASGDIVVTQVRPIPPAHRGMWDRVGDATWARLHAGGVPSIVPDSVGRYSGQVVDLRQRNPAPRDAGQADPVFVVHHQVQSGKGTATLQLLAWALREGVGSFGLLVDHGTARRNDHLDYILPEDPCIAFVVGATQLPDRFEAPSLSLESDGFALTVRSG